MKSVLILGGTDFVGRHLIVAAKDAGNKVAVFTSGSEPLRDYGVELIIGARTEDLTRLSNRTWDAVIDSSADPHEIEVATAYFADFAKMYAYCSSIDVYADFTEAELNEDSQLKKLSDETAADEGARRARCEQIVRAAFKERALIMRPGVMVGKYDPTDYFTYWVRRMSKGGTVLAPGDAAREVQFVDVRDVTEWTMRMVEANMGGVFNVTAPWFPCSMEHFLNELRSECKSNARLVWVSDEQLKKAGISGWQQLPFWVARDDERRAGYMNVDCTRAKNTGFSCRPIHVSARYVLEWDRTRDQSNALRAGLSEEQELEVLRAVSTNQLIV